MSAAAGDVAVVPDFSAEFAALFEARTLFFLGSWLEQFGEEAARQGAPRLHLCCIGEPPGSVRRLADRAGAVVSVHAPLAGFWGGLANKLRGLEGGEPGPRRLLVDADMLVLGPLEGLEEIPADFALAAAGKPQVPEEAWEVIYAALGMPLPETRIPSLRGRLGLGMEAVTHRYEGQQSEADAMLPYYNSGVLLVRGGCGLRGRWEDHLHRILRLATERPEMGSIHALVYNDQVGLATALQSLCAEGRTLALLADGWNARLVHLRAGGLRWGEIRLFHATGFLRGLQARADLPTALENYTRRWTEAIREGERLRPPEAGGSGDSEKPRLLLEKLWERWVRPEWERNSIG